MNFQQYDSVHDLISHNTKLKDRYHSIYPPLSELIWLLNEIIKTNQTTQRIFIIPFYVNEKLDFQEEFDFGGFYIECREKVFQEEQDNFWLENKFWGWPDAEYNILDKYVTDEDLKRSHFLVQLDDVDGFRTAILTYKKFLMERGIPQMMKWLYELCDLKDEDLPYGYFCFEVNSD